MVSVQLAALVVALSASGDTVLLDFQAPWCGPCRAMQSTIDELERSGYPVRRVNVDDDRQLAQQYRVQNIPCCVLLVDGQEAGRVTGAASVAELQAMFARAGVGRGTAQAPAQDGKSPLEAAFAPGGMLSSPLVKAGLVGLAGMIGSRMLRR